MDGAGQLRQLSTRVVHVLPVSDDGGSTAEIVRVLGGPAVGDIRSRCLRLADDSNEEVLPHPVAEQKTGSSLKLTMDYRIQARGSAGKESQDRTRGGVL